jgi:hypothetical protein
MGKEITAYDSLHIDRELEAMKNIIDDHSNYFFCKDQVERLVDMRIELNNILDSIIPE